jgi:hypothetical protein
MLDYPRWKYVVVTLVTLLALVFAAPNFFGEDYALQVARRDRAPVDDAARGSVEAFLKDRGVALPLIGVGGICSAQDVHAKRNAGACLIQAYTAFALNGFGIMRSW